MSGSSQTQPTISAYFASQSSSPSKASPKSRFAEKRTASSNYVDLTLEDTDIESVTKKSKITKHEQEGFAASRAKSSSSSSNRTTIQACLAAGPSTLRTPPRTSHVGSAQKYRFTGSVNEPDPNESPEDKRAKRARHDAFKRKLLEDNSLIRRSSRQPEAVVYPQSPSDDVMNVDEIGEKEAISESSDHDTNALPEFIRSKAFPQSRIKSAKHHKIDKDTSVKTRKKAREEIGPSGMPFTPLEKQVRGDPIV